MNAMRAYYYLTKPGLIYGNLLTVTGGYLYGAILRPELLTLLSVVAGSALVMASGTVLNNIQDRHIDKHMKRTKKRSLVTGHISVQSALVFAVICGSIGIALLALFTNILTLLLGIIGLVSYAGLYTYAKPRTKHATLIGTLPGAIPALAGYTAATGRIDVSFWIILLIMVCWQMTHFYSIAIYRSKEYAAAKIPVMPVVSSINNTKTCMVVYACGYMLGILALARFGYAGLFYLAIMVPLAAWWLLIVSSGFGASDDTTWAKKVFFVSLLLVAAWSIALGFNAWMP